MQAGVAVKKVDDTLDVIEEFCDALRAKVKEITSDLPGIVPLTWERMTPSLNEHECWEIVELLKNKDIVAGNWEIKNIGFIPLFPGQGGENDPIPNVNLGKYEEFRKRIANIINDLAACQHMNCTPAFAAFASNTCSMVTSHVAGKIQCAAIDPLIAIGADSFVDKIMPKYEFIDRQDAARKIVKVKRKQALGVSAGDQPDFLDNITSLFHKQTIEEQQFQEEISEQQRSDNQLIKQMDADNRAIDIVVNQQQQDMQIRDRQQLQIIEQKLPKFELNTQNKEQTAAQSLLKSIYNDKSQDIFTSLYANTLTAENKLAIKNDILLHLKTQIPKINQQKISPQINDDGIEPVYLFESLIGGYKLLKIAGASAIELAGVASVYVKRLVRSNPLPRKYLQEHHTIPKGLKDNKLWSLSETNCEEEFNKILLPTKKGAELYKTKASIHEGRHLGKVTRELEDKMNEVVKEGELKNFTQKKYRSELMKIIKEEKKLLETGRRALNKNKQPWADK